MSEKRLDIQGLRGWAILLVLLFHFFPDYFPNGYIGVDMFFVISGFLIAMILRRSDNLDMEAFRSFYYRRIKRILPLYYLAIACILIALFFLLPPSYRSMNIDSSRRAIILISNIKKLDVDANYQKMLVNAEDLFTHTWSLCVEMQWYLLVPLIFVAQRFATAWEKTFFTGVAISSIAFYLLADEMNSFYCVLARIWQFCCGVLALLVQNEEPVKDLPQHEKIAFLDSETCEDEGQKTSYELKHPFFSICIFVTTIAVPFTWWPLPTDIFRAGITCLSAVLIHIGNYHQTVLLSNPVAVYVGNISYALYLFHWPAYIIAKNYSSEVPFALLLGLVSSISMAVAAYHLFEKYYLTWPPQGVLPMLTVLVAICAILALQPRSVEEQMFGQGPVNYSVINPNDAAWNMTLMRYLNFKENNLRGNLEVPGCVYSTRFLNEYAKPVGFCTMENGSGNNNFLVVGNSFACNQAGLIYSAFKQHIRQFNVFCYFGCEVMTWTPKAKCWRRVNYTAMVQELKPDIVFVMSRSFMAKAPFDTMKPIDGDKIFQDHLSRMTVFEKIAKKVYLLQALPSCVTSCSAEAQKFMSTGKPLRDVQEGLIRRDDFFARQRIQEVGKRFGKERIQVFFNQLAKTFNISK
ncbi:hypothetical protein Aduo_013611 [Ancylostoma duodenale]